METTTRLGPNQQNVGVYGIWVTEKACAVSIRSAEEGGPANKRRYCATVWVANQAGCCWWWWWATVCGQSKQCPMIELYALGQMVRSLCARQSPAAGRGLSGERVGQRSAPRPPQRLQRPQRPAGRASEPRCRPQCQPCLRLPRPACSCEKGGVGWGGGIPGKRSSWGCTSTHQLGLPTSPFLKQTSSVPPPELGNDLLECGPVVGVVCPAALGQRHIGIQPAEGRCV